MSHLTPNRQHLRRPGQAVRPRWVVTAILTSTLLIFLRAGAFGYE